MFLRHTSIHPITPQERKPVDPHSPNDALDHLTMGQEAARSLQIQRDRRLHQHLIPRMRACALLVIAGLLSLHNSAVFQEPWGPRDPQIPPLNSCSPTNPFAESFRNS